MAKFGVSHSANGNASLQNLVDDEENRDQSIIYWPNKKYTFCTSEGGGSVLILRRPVFFQDRAAALILRQLGFLTYLRKPLV
jgi:hypothetical protein